MPSGSPHGRSGRPKCLRRTYASTAPTALLVDMDKGEEALVTIRQARAALPWLAIVAFGPHVAKELLQARERLARAMCSRAGRWSTTWKTFW